MSRYRASASLELILILTPAILLIAGTMQFVRLYRGWASAENEARELAVEAVTEKKGEGVGQIRHYRSARSKVEILGEPFDVEKTVYIYR